MTGINIFRNTAGNIRPSVIARDMGLRPNGEFFLQRERVVAGMFGDGNGLLAMNLDAGLKIPPYLRKIPVVSSFRSAS